MKHRVAALQFNPIMFEPEANLARLEAMTIEAAQQGARLILHPEMGVTGYCWQSREEIAPFVEPVPGPITDRFQAIAAEYDCWIAVGLAEVEPGTGIFYNTLALIGPDGVAGKYRKTHSYIAEPAWAKDGDLGFTVVETPIGNIGMIVCMDVVYFETVRLQALQGADVICLPVNWAGEKSPAGSWMARAVENGITMVVANRSDTERDVTFCGQSCVIGPDGVAQAILSGGEGIVFGEFESPAPERSRRLRDRRPDLYRSLTRNAYLWHPEAFHGRYGIAPLPKGRASRIAAGQFVPVAGDIEGNLATITELASQVVGVDLLVLPELALTGSVDATNAAAFAELCTTVGIDGLRVIASNAGITLVAGVIERAEDGRLFNSAAVIDGSGVRAMARKAHLGAGDCGWATPGDRPLAWIDLPLGRVGVLLGDDLRHPESARVLAIEGADVLAVPANLPWPPPTGGTPGAENFILPRQQARENKVYLAMANGAGVARTSGVFGPDPEGHPEDESLIGDDGAAVVVHSIDTTSPDPNFPTNPIRRKDTLRMRQPFWYDPLQV